MHVYVRIGVRKVGSRAVGHGIVEESFSSDVGDGNEKGSNHVGEGRGTVRNSYARCRLVHTVRGLILLLQRARASCPRENDHARIRIASTERSSAIHFVKVWNV